MARTARRRRPPASPDPDPDNRFDARLAALANRIARGVARVHTEGHGVGIAEWRALAAIARHAPVSANEVIRHTGVDKGTLSRAVDGLVGNGWVVKTVDPADQRRHVLTLSADGRAMHGRIAPKVAARERALLSVLPKADRAALERMIDRLLRQADRMLTDPID